ncbi:MAG TPA: DoxX family protein [Lacibacter sp.]|nr:DoxX family protein [Lacibacter sp.]HMO89813.1 DoxX family protein [Lacibacter sp.]HMP87759.1 DoxX family protein [Lacibacter sp.]
MNLIQRLEKWGDEHHPKWIDFIRIVLGIVLVLKGVQYINNMTSLSALLNKGPFTSTALVAIVSHYVIFAHLIGGLLIATGLLTRFACIVQIPILLGAVIFVNAPAGLFTQSELWFSFLILILLVFFTLEGSGPISVDQWMKTHSDERPHKHKWE